MNRFCCSLFCVMMAFVYSGYGADLIDKDGRVYRNYRIKNVRNGQVEVLYSLPDGRPDSCWVRFDRLPDVLQRQYQKKYKDWQSGKTLREKLVLAGRQLERDLSRFAPEDHHNRYAVANKLAVQLERVLAAYGETADFALVAGERNGALLRVVGTGEGSQLRSGQYIYMYKGNPRIRAFRMKLYPVGDVMNHAKYGKIAIYAENTEKAVQAAVDFIGRSIGNSAVFLPPPVHSYSQENEVINTGVVNNIYYSEERKSYKRPTHPPKLPPQKPGAAPGNKPEKPSVCPAQKPDRPGLKPGVAPGNKPEKPSVRPGRKPDDEGKGKPGSQNRNDKKDQKSGGWNWVPEWGIPGSGINDKRR